MISNCTTSVLQVYYKCTTSVLQVYYKCKLVLHSLFHIFFKNVKTQRLKLYFCVPNLFWRIYLFILAWDSSFAYQKKSQPTQLRILNPAQTILFFLQSSPIKVWGKSVQRFISYDWTSEQTNRDFFTYKLAWESSVAQGTHSYSRRLPALSPKLQF